MANIKAYLADTYHEMVHKVSWPTWKELQSSAILVLIASVIIALIIFLMDYVMGINGQDSFWKGVLGYVYDMLS